jgi:hypothetical protein
VRENIFGSKTNKCPEIKGTGQVCLTMRPWARFSVPVRFMMRAKLVETDLVALERMHLTIAPTNGLITARWFQQFAMECLMAKEWTASQTWIMTFVSGALLLLCAWLGNSLWNNFVSPIPSDAARTSVFSLVNDLRRTPILFRVILLHQHDFMKTGKTGWEKNHDTDDYLESAITPSNLMMFAYIVGHKNITSPLLQPSHGYVIGIPKGIDVIREGNETKYMGEIEVHQDTNIYDAKIELKETNIFSLEKTMLPTNLLSHINDLSLPPKIRNVLSVFNQYPHTISFKKGVAQKIDFLLLSHNIGEAKENQLTDETALYVFDVFGSASDFVHAALLLVEALQDWSKKYSIELELFLPPGPSSDGRSE